MGSLKWVTALVRRRPARMLGAAAGVALAVALLGSLGAFLTSAKAQMTKRAVARVVVDWQVEAQPGADPAAVLATVGRAAHVRAALPVGFGSTTGLEATVGGTIQSTGPGSVLGLAPEYQATFPGQVRTLTGSDTGVLVAQQTAANLHVAPGDTVRIGRAGLPPATVKVDAVVDLPQIDSLFQKVGAPAGAQPQAPPDNVVLLPLAVWHDVFDPLSAARPDLVRTQVHARLDHQLPSDPAAAFTQTTGMAHRLEVDLAGAGLVGDNLAATLDAARADALYAGVLFVLLGLPGAVLAGLLTRSVAAAGRDRRRRELALLRARGASLAQLQRLATAEAATVAALGAAAGLVLAAVVGRVAFGSSTLGATTGAAVVWAIGSVLFGAVIALATVAIPARRQAATVSVAANRRMVGRATRPLALRYGLDLALLAAAALVFWASSRNGYNLVLAPEGVPTVSVNYWALAGPLLLWVGTGLFAWRVADTLLGRGRGLVRGLLRPVAGTLAAPVASTLRRQRSGLATAIVLVALTGAFAISTSVFNATFRQQVGVDALLTNGAAVTVTKSPGARTAPDEARRLAAVPGVGHIEPLQHRYVYVGNDLQDLFGVNPNTIGSAGKLQDAYFTGGSASQVLQRLASSPDALLVSDETVKDFQLHLGDALHLRIRDARTGNLVPVAFHYAGVAKEFPTAPKDSFLIGNASYIADQTGNPAPDAFLIGTNGSAPPSVVAGRVRQVVGPGETVTDIDSSRRVVGSSLTAVDLAGLTRVELGYALVLAAAATGLVLALGFAQRRRTFVITSALGARPKQVAAFARAEAWVLGVLGGVLGIAGGWLLANMLVKVLTRVFDPPPAHLAVPWQYLSVVLVIAAAAIVAATRLSVRVSQRPAVEALRDL